MRDSIRIEETAARWLARRDAGDWDDAQQSELDQWIDASVAHRIAYLRLASAWERARRLDTLALGDCRRGSTVDAGGHHCR
jgi:transmembrane sensor